jgi:serine/threonine protein phosphatase 1
VFFGHTVLSGPFATPYAVGLDTGCVHGRGLTAYDCGRDKFVTVDSTEYEPRSADSIVAASPDTEQFA